MKGNKTNHPKKWMRWDDWETWLLKEWYPFRTNDLPHMKTDIVWIKFLLGGVILALIGAAIAVLSKG